MKTFSKKILFMGHFYEKLHLFQRKWTIFLFACFEFLNAFIPVYNEQKWKYTNITPPTNMKIILNVSLNIQTGKFHYVQKEHMALEHVLSQHIWLGR